MTTTAYRHIWVCRLPSFTHQLPIIKPTISPLKTHFAMDFHGFPIISPYFRPDFALFRPSFHHVFPSSCSWPVPQGKSRRLLRRGRPTEETQELAEAGRSEAKRFVFLRILWKVFDKGDFFDQSKKMLKLNQLVRLKSIDQCFFLINENWLNIGFWSIENSN